MREIEGGEGGWQNAQSPSRGGPPWRLINLPGHGQCVTYTNTQFVGVKFYRQHKHKTKGGEKEFQLCCGAGKSCHHFFVKVLAFHFTTLLLRT